MALGIAAIAQSPISSLGGKSAFVDVTGLELTSELGNVTVTAIQNPTVAVTGIELTGALGQAQTDPDVIAVGQQLSITTATPTIIADANIEVTGQSLTPTLGDEIAFTDVTVEVTGINAGTVEVNSVEIDLNTPVDLTGNSLNIDQASPSIIAWSNVDPDVTNVWTEVDTEDNNTWSEVDIAA